jgi:hypothetical protein
MKLTKNIFQDFCEEQGWSFRAHATAKFRMYSAIRIYYPDCELSANYLYITDSVTLPSGRDKALVDICLIADDESTEGGFSYTIIAPCGLPTFFSALQTKHEQLQEWDRKLSELLLNGGTIQEILDSSAQVLRNPCMFQDDQFHVLASVGQVSQEVAPFYYEAQKTGRVPVRLFEKLLALSPQARAPYSISNIVTVVQHFSQHDELLANCLVDGVIVLRFCMICVHGKSNGLRDIVGHLIHRIEHSPGIREYTGWPLGSADSLFTRIIEMPMAPDIASTIDALGIDSFTLLSVVCIDFGTQTAEASSILIKLRMLLPNMHFFVYKNIPYALLGINQKSGAVQGDALERFEALLFTQLDHMGATYGVSLCFSDPLLLQCACNQAKCALDALHQLPDLDPSQPASRHRMVRYQNAFPFHVLKHFFRAHDFSAYCPKAFLDLINDDRNFGTNNLHLLHVYLTNKCNATIASRLLHMHRNNVIYRINKIEEKYHINLNNSLQRQIYSLLCLAVIYQCDLTVATNPIDNGYSELEQKTYT